MRFSEASGRKIVSTSTAETVGKIDSFVVDPKARRVVALSVGKGGVLRWDDIHSFGQDAVTVSAADRLTAGDESLSRLAAKEHDILGKRVLNTAGDEIGKTIDVDFDPETSQITELVLDRGPIDGARLIGVGSYAVVVHHQDAPTGGATAVTGT